MTRSALLGAARRSRSGNDIRHHSDLELLEGFGDTRDDEDGIGDLSKDPELPVDDSFVADLQACLVRATQSPGQAARENRRRDRWPGVIGHARTRRYQSWSVADALRATGAWGSPRGGSPPDLRRGNRNE